MKIYTNENNTATLKLLIAAKLAGKDVELLKGTYEEAPGPAVLPRLEVHEELSFFSSNAAVQYLFPVLDLSQNGHCQQMQEWEATRLQPVVAAVLTSKTVSSELKEGLNSLLLVVDRLLKEHQYILGDKLSPADISIFSTLYPLCQTDLKTSFLAESDHVARWAAELGSARAVQEAIQQWGGAPGAPPAPSPLGALPTVALSPAGSPEEAPAGPTPEELELAKDHFINGLKYLQAPLKREKVILPLKDRRNVLITSALPYVNNVPHLGNIIGCVLSADIFARYCRLCDYNTLFVCGTDEYGTATETKALEEGVSPREVCDKYHDIHAAVYRWFDIDFDHFGRTSTAQQTTIAQKMFSKLNANGFVSKQTVEQLYCERCTRFLADRLRDFAITVVLHHPTVAWSGFFWSVEDPVICKELHPSPRVVVSLFVEGTCPHPGCLSPDARGDQCDRCGKLINATELKNPRCKQCGETPSIRNSDQLFIDLPLLEPSLRSWSLSAEGAWSGPARGVLRAWQREPLRARAVTRDLKWGVPVPLPDFTHKVFYVWFDAPIGYLSITECATGQHERWWKRSPDYDVKLYQFMAKDNVPFHAIMFPATVMGVNDGHLLVDHIFATEYLNYEDSKFSKSRGVGVFGTDAQDTGIPPDVWRFYLAAIRPETSDSVFSWSDLATRNNSELLNNLGNFCHRSLSFCYSTYGGAVPAAALEAGDLALLAGVNRDVAGYVQFMSKGRLREALRLVLSVSRSGNLYMQERQPWSLNKGGQSEREKAATTISVCCQLVALLATLLAPFMPDTSRRLSHQLNIEHGALRLNPSSPSVALRLPPGHLLNKPEPLFSKIEPATALALRDKYAGTQTHREQLNDDALNQACIAELEAAAAEQGEIVRKLKAFTRDKAVWLPEVNKLLEFKKLLADARSPPTRTDGQTADGSNVTDLEKAIAEQGDKVRKLKASTKDKSVWQPEVNKLLDLKKQLTAAQAQTNVKTNRRTGPHSAATIESLQAAISAQGYKILDLQHSEKNKLLWESEVNVLNDLQKQLLILESKSK